MKEKQRMGRLFAEGWSISAIAKELKVDRKTVRQYVQQADYSESLPQAPVRASNLDSFKPTIQQWLADDARVRYKQRHTVARIHQRLHETFPDTYDCSYSTVQRYVKEVRTARSHAPIGTLELDWEPGVMQVDFGEADVYWEPDDVRLTTVKYLTVSFPFSNAGLFQYFPGETAECVVDGLVSLFQWLGGVPSRIVFDNATGIGRRIGEVIQYAELFERFQAHYRFEATFCNPESGHEKGNEKRAIM